MALIVCTFSDISICDISYYLRTVPTYVRTFVHLFPNSLKFVFTTCKTSIIYYILFVVSNFIPLSNIRLTMTSSKQAYVLLVLLSSLMSGINGLSFRGNSKASSSMDESLDVDEDSYLDFSCVNKNNWGDNTKSCVESKDADGKNCFSCQTTLSTLGFSDQNICMNQSQKDLALKLQKQYHGLLDKYLEGMDILTDCKNTMKSDDDWFIKEE